MPPLEMYIGIKGCQFLFSVNPCKSCGVPA